MKNIFLICLAIAVIFVFSGCVSELILNGVSSVYGNTSIAVGMSFPPFSDSDQIDFSVRKFKELATNRIRISVDWRNREPLQGKFYWAPMDMRMSAAEENGIKVMLTISSLCPDWARVSTGSDGTDIINEDALNTFIEAVLSRYDNIDKIQFGNEWESGTKDGTTYTSFSSVENYVAYNNILYDAVQRISPETEVVLGGLTRAYPIVEYFAAQGKYPDFSGLILASGETVAGLRARVDRLKAEFDEKGIKQNIEYVFANANYDILDIHLYDDPENWPEYLSVLPDNKPIIVSEFGGPNSEFERTWASYQAERMKEYIDAIEQLPITEAYYFKLVDSKTSYHEDSGLYYSSLFRKPARNVFAARLTPIE
jgi:hypothetical protein